MSLSRKQVVDALNDAFRTAWNTAVPGDRIKWPNVGKTEDSGDKAPFTGDEPWARVIIRHIPNLGKITLSNAVGGRRYDRRGVMIVQVFSERGEGLPGNVDLPKVVQDAFEGKSLLSGLVIRRVDVQEIGESGNWYQTNVSISFEYDELR